MTKYAPIIHYCQERIKSLETQRDSIIQSTPPELEMTLSMTKALYIGLTNEHKDVIALCQKMDNNEKWLRLSLGLPAI